jgi:hypothetical protein
MDTVFEVADDISEGDKVIKRYNYVFLDDCGNILDKPHYEECEKGEVVKFEELVKALNDEIVNLKDGLREELDNFKKEYYFISKSVIDKPLTSIINKLKKRRLIN